MYGCRSRTRRNSTSEAGRKPRSPMSRMSPPLTTSMTGPVTTPSRSLTPSMVPQARSYWARFLDRISRPSLSSFWRTRASMCSPSVTTSLGSTSWRIDSSRAGMTPSDLKPMSRRTSSLSTLTTVPVTMSPSSNSTIVPAMASSSEVLAQVVGDDLARGVLTGLVEGAHLGGVCRRLGRDRICGSALRWSRWTWSRSLLSGQRAPPERAVGGGAQRTVRRGHIQSTPRLPEGTPGGPDLAGGRRRSPG